MYGRGDLSGVDDRLCPWCIADGKAAATFEVEFTDVSNVPADVPAEITDVLSPIIRFRSVRADTARLSLPRPPLGERFCETQHGAWRIEAILPSAPGLVLCRRGFLFPLW
jgi:hypothetical protein